jgi:hypothetical protein
MTFCPFIFKALNDPIQTLQRNSSLPIGLLAVDAVTVAIRRSIRNIWKLLCKLENAQT